MNGVDGQGKFLSPEDFEQVVLDIHKMQQSS